MASTEEKIFLYQHGVNSGHAIVIDNVTVGTSRWLEGLLSCKIMAGVKAPTNLESLLSQPAPLEDLKD